MDYLDALVDGLKSARSCGYHQGAQAATEPAALAAMALLGCRNDEAALPLLDWLVERQAADGSLGVSATQNKPCWPTGWAVLAWLAGGRSKFADERFAAAAKGGCDWICQAEGNVFDRIELKGHDTTLKGWPWVIGTHSWIEPTAIQLLALKRAELGDRARAREAVWLLQDRLLASGGCNYGNTIVLGQELRPHVQPTGICLAALAGEADSTDKTQRAIDYLHRELNEQTTAVSLSFGLIGLAAHDSRPRHADAWIEACAKRVLARDRSAFKLALLALAALGEGCPLIPPTMESTDR